MKQQSKTDNTVLKDMIITMLLYGIIAQIVCLIIPGDHLRMTAGLWIGVAAGVFMVIHMKNSLDEAVLYGEQEAQRYMAEILRDKISGCSCSIYSRQLASDCECTYTVCRNYEFKACGIFAANYA